VILAVFAFSAAGKALKTRLAALLEREGYRICPVSSGIALSEAVGRAFQEAQGLIFIGACGIAVRGIAPFIKSKTRDPAVLVLDENGTWVISLLSGHIGGANALARTVAALLDAQPVITTATDLRGVFAVDLWAAAWSLVIGSMEKAKTLSARLLAGEEIPLQSDYPVTGPLPQGLKEVSQDSNAAFGMIITIFTKPETRQEWLRLIPRSVYLGIGCRKGTPLHILDRTITAALEARHIDIRSIAGAGTIDLKKDEPGLAALCEEKRWPLHSYSAEQLMAVPGGFTGSPFVEAVTGADNVCERAAVMASGRGNLLFGKYAGEGVTVAGAEKPPAFGFEEEL
jgi:cobalt-precorrin 5A hydrolase